MIALEPIGVVHSLFKEKFGVPKQSQMNTLESVIVVDKNIPIESFSGIEDMSHIWVIFYFHHNNPNTGATVRPPLLGGNKKVGIYSSRSSFRHNNIGLSLVRLIKVDWGLRQLVVCGLDCTDGTPVLDIKPYHPVADIPLGDVHCGWIEKTKKGQQLEVEFAIEVEPSLQMDIIQVLRNDPRPSYHQGNQSYGMHFGEYNIIWLMKDKDTAVVIKLEKL